MVAGMGTREASLLDAPSWSDEPCADSWHLVGEWAWHTRDPQQSRPRDGSPKDTTALHTAAFCCGGRVPAFACLALLKTVAQDSMKRCFLDKIFFVFSFIQKQILSGATERTQTSEKGYAWQTPPDIVSDILWSRLNPEHCSGSTGSSRAPLWARWNFNRPPAHKCRAAWCCHLGIFYHWSNISRQML